MMTMGKRNFMAVSRLTTRPDVRVKGIELKVKVYGNPTCRLALAGLTQNTADTPSLLQRFFIGEPMADYTVWWLLAGAMVALELVSGTFYLLMLAAGMAAAALAAHLGLGTSAQLVTAAVVGLGLVVGWYQLKKRRPGDPSARAMRSVNLDIGEVIQIDQWQPDGTASVKYRGAQWAVIQRPGNPPIPGAYRVAELVGSRLLVEKV
jgi:membrane protein implicated in regulation of membrane protease activity